MTCFAGFCKQFACLRQRHRCQGQYFLSVSMVSVHTDRVWNFKKYLDFGDCRFACMAEWRAHSGQVLAGASDCYRPFVVVDRIEFLPYSDRLFKQSMSVSF